MAQKKKRYFNYKKNYGNNKRTPGITGIINQSSEELKRITTRTVEDFLLHYNFEVMDINAVSINTGMLERELYDQLVVRGKDGNYSKSIVNKAYLFKYNLSFKEWLGERLVNTYPAALAFSETNPYQFEQQLKEGAQKMIRRFEVIAREQYENLIFKNNSFKGLFGYIREQRKKIDGLIYDSIPESVPKLYPLARTLKRHFILHIGPTNSGKTYDALQALKKARSGIYLAPLRLLAFEVYDRVNEAGVPCNMITGEEEIIKDNAHHVSATIETLDVLSSYDLAVIDEGQLIGEKQRGGAWTRAILGVCAPEVHICSDDSCVDIITKIIEECGDTYEITKHERAVPLQFDNRAFVFPESVEEKDALIVFSKKSVIAVAAELQRFGIKTSIIYGALPYDVRMNEVRRFIEGETQVVVATDAIGMGLNLPIRRMVFLELNKFDGERRRILNATEVKQIAGRAGRRGIFDVGYYNSEFQGRFIRECVEGELPKIEKARISIPESIINLNFALSDIMRRWLLLQNDEIYEKADLEEDIAICVELEPIVRDKDMLYNLITIAFDKGKASLVSLLKEFAKIQVDYTGNDDELNRVIDANIIMTDELLDELNMEGLETLYSRYDLMYGFLRKFGHRDRLADIVDAKRECSARIMEMLKKQALETKKCVDCGVELSWNYPYSRCEHCHRIYRDNYAPKRRKY